MENEFSKRVSEVLDIIKHSEEEIKNKIPNKFMQFLTNNQAKDYNVTIDYLDENWADKLENETKGLLALIYRDYLVSGEEREKLISREQKEKEIEENKKREKYNPDNIFNKNDKTKNEILQEEAIQEVQNALMVIKEEKWYNKIINIIKEFFGIKHK